MKGFAAELNQPAEPNQSKAQPGLSFPNLFLAMVVLALATVLPDAAYAQAPEGKEPRVLRVGYIEFPPFEYTDEQGKPAGYFIDVLRLTFERAGYKPHFQALPIARAYLFLKEGRIDVWPGLTEIPALKDYVLESRSVPSQITLNAWFMPGTPPIHNIDDMKDHRVILITGYTYGGLIEYFNDPSNRFEVLLTPGHDSALEMLKRGRGDYLLGYVEPIEASLAKRPLPELQQVSLSKRDGSFIVSRKASDAEEIVRRLDDAYMQLRAENVIDYIRIPKLDQ